MPTPPKQFCTPSDASDVNVFGNPSATTRVWHPPVDRPDEMNAFREAVVQHAICLNLRRYKNSQGMSRARLAAEDDRTFHAEDHWRKVLTGAQKMSVGDITVVLRVLPAALPHLQAIPTLMQVAEKLIAPPAGWTEIDR